MESLLSPDAIISFISLCIMEIILGVDNIIFISILTSKLPESQRGKARLTGLLLALAIRIALLFMLSWLIGLDKVLFTLDLGFIGLQVGHGFSGKDLILIAGGLFLVYKSTTEIHNKLEGDEHDGAAIVKHSLSHTIVQIVLLDVVFSIDSILTAIGLVDSVLIMVAAVIVSMTVMILTAKSISDFIQKHPALKMLALAFLLLIGVLLIVEGLGQHVPKGYIYFAIFFSLFVELLNMRTRKKKKTTPVHLRKKYMDGPVTD